MATASNNFQSREDVHTWVLMNINLSRYDRKFFFDIDNKKLKQNLALTMGQNILWEKIITKYHKQLTQSNQTVENLLAPVWKLPPLPLQQEYLNKRIWVDQEKICIQFPFNRKMVDELRDLKSKETKFQRNDHKDLWTFNHIDKIWYVELTVKTARTLYEFAKKHQLELDKTFADLVDPMLELGPANLWSVALHKVNDRYYVNNLNVDLADQISDFEFTVDIPTVNFIRSLGIDPGDQFLTELRKKYPQILSEFFDCDSRIAITDQDFSSIKDYCAAAGIDNILLLSSRNSTHRLPPDLVPNVSNLTWPMSAANFKSLVKSLEHTPLLLLANGLYVRALFDEYSFAQVFKSQINKMLTLVDISEQQDLLDEV